MAESFGRNAALLALMLCIAAPSEVLGYSAILRGNMIEQANQFAARGNFAMAARTLERMLALEPGDINIACMLFDLQVRAGNFEKAEKLLMNISRLTRGRDTRLQDMGARLLAAREAEKSERDEELAVFNEIREEYAAARKAMTPPPAAKEPPPPKPKRPSYGPAFDPLWEMVDSGNIQEAAAKYVSMVMRSRQILENDDGGLAALLLENLRSQASEQETETHLFLRSAMEALAGSVETATTALRRYSVEYPEGKNITDATHLLAQLGSIKSLEPSSAPQDPKARQAEIRLQRKKEITSLKSQISTPQQAEAKLASLENYSRDLQAEINFVKQEFSERRSARIRELESIRDQNIADTEDEDEQNSIKVFYGNEANSISRQLQDERDLQIREIRNRLTQVTREILRVRKIQEDLAESAAQANKPPVQPEEEPEEELIERFIPESPFSRH